MKFLQALALFTIFGVAQTACGGGVGSERQMSESLAAGLVREKLGHENQGFFVACEVIDFDANGAVWRIRCSLTNAQGTDWSDWRVDDRPQASSHRRQMGEPGFPSSRSQPDDSDDEAYGARTAPKRLSTVLVRLVALVAAFGVRDATANTNFSPTAQLKLCNSLGGGCSESLGTGVNADQTLTVTSTSGELSQAFGASSTPQAATLGASLPIGAVLVGKLERQRRRSVCSTTLAAHPSPPHSHS